MHDLTKAIFCEGNPPALAIKVASPGDTARDTVDKRLEYALTKVPEYWIINPVDGYVLVLTFDDDANEYREIGEYRGAELILNTLINYNYRCELADHKLSCSSESWFFINGV